MTLCTSNRTRIAAFLAMATIASACGDAATPDATSTDPTASTTTSTAPTTSAAASESDSGAMVLAAAWSDNVTITIDGDNWVFESDGLPSHEVLEQYLADGQDGKYLSGGVVASPTTLTFPLVPTLADAPTQTSGGTIGVAVSGAVFFNPYEGDGTDTVANDDNSTIDGVPFIDACGGHPLPNGDTYHYHGIPFCVTDALDTAGEHSEAVGYLLDGHAIYGPQDVGGEEPTDLDECMGHTGLVPGSDTATYHYHVSTQANYISACLVGEFTSARPGRP